MKNEFGNYQRNSKMSRWSETFLKKQWPSSAEHRNEIPGYQMEPLIISGEEDVPGIECFSERFLSLGQGPLNSRRTGKQLTRRSR
jgi:hypothetical protein